MASSGNFCTWNPIHAQGGGTPDLTRNGTLTQGNLNYDPGSYGIIIGSQGVSTGKWYWELRATGLNASGPVVGWLNERHTSGGSNFPSPGYSSPSSASDAQFIMLYLLPGSGPSEIVAGTPSGSSSGTDTDKSSIAANDIIGVAGDFDNNKWYFSINGSFTDMRSGQNPATGTNPLCSEGSGGGLETFTRVSGFTWYPTYGNWSASGKASYTNFGQDSTFGGGVSAGGNADENGFGDFKYAVPAGFLAMCSGNLPISDDIDPAQTNDDIPTKLFDPILYTGNGSTNAVTGLGFQPDFVWLKRRDSSASHQLYDSNRGTGKLLSSDNTDAEQTVSTGLNSFDSDGFTLGTAGGANASSGTFVAWCWRASGGQAQNKTYAVTVVDDGGNKYRFDGHGTSAVTLDVNEGSTITFDQSDNTNDGHPLRIYTASDKSGGEYTTGVTTTGTAGQAGAKTVITVAASAPTLYYQCSIHGGMGGQINTNALSAGIGNSHTAGTTITKVQKNIAAGFSIVTYTGTGSNATLEHGLSTAPDFMIIKDRDGTNNYVTYSREIGANKRSNLNNDIAWSSSSTSFQSTHPSSSIITLGTSNGVNQSSRNFVCYAWHNVEGYQHFGTYTGNGNTNGPYIYTGFRPVFVFLKKSSNTGFWNVFYSPPKAFNSSANAYIVWNDNGSEASGVPIDFTSNGFNIRSSGNGVNQSSETFVFGAWGDVPYKYNNPF